jgi:hypothetical protein
MSGPVRARDLRVNVQQLGFEKGMMTTLELLLEEMVLIRQLTQGCVEMQNEFVRVISDLVQISDELRNRVETQQKMINGGHDG